ncbi:hypothetical protein BHU72_06895 [Desulfuribacillus stibiiarsenatis]|uniref:Uncharacterized protein n=1 Tax=Desulfuribacillus stibiiarsenatis TaxID=1390249 RepID=A0A1E5L4D3_9FIRM|nr:hypothetical protein BHU72_06895 [Desulfuribacillus stibiiarsenatis]
MIIVYLFLAVTLLSVIFTIRMKKPLLLTVPFFAIFLYVVVLIAMVPMGFLDTVQLIFNLR